MAAQRRSPSRAHSALAGVFLVLLPAAVFPAGHQVVRTSDRTWTISYQCTLRPVGTMEIDGVGHRVYAGPYHPEASAPGSPGLPVEVFSLGIPFGPTVSAELVDPVYVDEASQHIAPIPIREGESDSSARGVYRKDPSAYAQRAFAPAPVLVVESPFVLRGQRMVTIRLAPLQFQPATGVLRTMRSARIVVRLSGEQIPAHPQTSDPGYDQVFHSMLDNADEARQWRAVPATFGKVAQDSTRLWFQAHVPYVKIGIAADGWYRIPLRLLEPLLGMGTTAGSIGVVCRGMEVPLWITSDSLVEFYGLRSRGDSAFLDDYSDTNAYWLRSGVPGPRRFTPAVVLSAPADTVRTANQTEHFEENHSLYVGTTEQEVISNSPIPGRGWVWDFFYPGTSYTYQFALDTVTGSGPGLLAVRLYSTTLHYSTPDHKARFWINDSLVAETGFTGRTESISRIAVPAGLLRSGVNTLKIASVPTASSPNQFYLDWFEVTRARPLVVREGQLRFHAAASHGAPIAFEVRGLSSPDVAAFDLSNARAVSGGVIVQEAGGSYGITFEDTLSTERDYLVAASGKTPAVMRRRVLPDLRDNSRGADYIVVTHAVFSQAASDLAAFRERVNGVRATVIDVEDVYDEFNYGVKNPLALKQFLRYAAGNWPEPRPSSVLLFGGACYDAKGYEAGPVKVDYVPAYGTPTGDNWFACFDESHPYLPSLLLGRLSMDTPAQASAVVAKLKRYEGYDPAAWNKRFLCVTGGNSDAEQATFDQITSSMVTRYLTPPPIGGEVLRVQKQTSVVIDGDSRRSIKEMIRDGVVHLNFLGHSGGRIWNVDVGDPAEFPNTDGDWPFVTSVSCGVSSFASPFDNCLAEDFVFADGRGAIAVWGSSSLGYAFYGSTLVENLLDEMTRDTVRQLGALTTSARIRLWQAYGANPISIAHINLTPLIGDPLTRLALPIRPDLAVASEDLSFDRAVVTAADSALICRAVLHNFGLVPGDSVEVEAYDAYASAPPALLFKTRRPPIMRSDTIDLHLKTFDRAGKHTVQISVDPHTVIREVRTANNSISTIVYVYSSSTRVVRPFDNGVVAAGAQTLVITVPGAGSAASSSAHFELDTVPAFTSSWKIVSGPVVPGPVAARWVSPSLPVGGTYFWRGRIDVGAAEGAWVTSSFVTSAETVQTPFMRWRQSSRGQFDRNLKANVTSSDTGVSLAAPAPIRLYARSLGARSTVDADQFSAIRVNDESTLGYWWSLGYGIMVARVDPLTGLYELRSFDIGYKAGDADSLAAFVAAARQGSYLVLAVIIDGATGATEGFYEAVEALGSTAVRHLKAGDAWTFIARKGPGSIAGLPSERVSSQGLALDSVEVPVRYGAGSMEGLPLPRAARWGAFGWEGAGTGARIALAGVSSSGVSDSLTASSAASGTLDVHALNARGVADAYRYVRPVIAMSTADPVRSPLLRSWWIDLVPAADLAIGPARLAWRAQLNADLAVTVQNIGSRRSDSARCAVMVGDGTSWKTVTVGPVPELPIDSSVTLALSIPVVSIPPRTVMRVVLTPTAGSVDLFDDNNSLDLSVERANPITGRIQVLADNAEVLNGDFLPTNPALRFRVPGRAGVIRRTLRAIIDAGVAGEQVVRPDTSAQGATVDELVLTPVLGRGAHEIRTWVLDEYPLGGPDSTVAVVQVKVADELRILNLFNYPNPFGGSTDFTFALSGSRDPEGGTISVYTIAGRKIRRFELEDLRIGFNRIPWDGRDQDGDEIANGTYLYRLEVRLGGEQQVAGGKVVRIR